MQFCLLTRFLSMTSSSRFVARMVAEAAKNGHQFSLINPDDTQVDLSHKQNPVMYRGEAFPAYDLIHFALRWDDEVSWRLVDALHLCQYKVHTSARLPLGDRVTMARLFAKAGMEVPKSWMVRSQDQLELMVGDFVYPLLLKSRSAKKGRVVQLLHEEGDVRATAATLLKQGGELMLQQAPEQLGYDKVAFVVGDQIVAAVERQMQNNQVTLTAVDLSAAEQHLAVAATQLYDAPYAAVSMTPTEHGPVFMELSRIPNLDEAEEATGVNIAGHMVAHCAVLAGQARSVD